MVLSADAAVQAYIAEAVRVVGVMIDGGVAVDRAIDWFRGVPLANVGLQTAEEQVFHGRAGLVLSYLDDWQAHRQPSFSYCYRAVLRAVDARYDVRGSVLAEMVRSCLMNRATLPVTRRTYYAEHATPEAMRHLEQLTSRLLFGRKGRFSPEEFHYLR